MLIYYSALSHSDTPMLIAKVVSLATPSSKREEGLVTSCTSSCVSGMQLFL